MDRVFYRLTAISWSFYLFGAISVCVGVWLLNVLPWALTQRLASRLLPLLPTVILAAAYLILHLPRCQTIYVRAHKQDPFLLAAVVSHGLIAAAVIVLGRAYGPIGAAWGLLAVVSLVNLPWWTMIWMRTRRDWHSPASTT
jgi:O-antigen/teichoic acid export membrane protein